MSYSDNTYGRRLLLESLKDLYVKLFACHSSGCAKGSTTLEVDVKTYIARICVRFYYLQYFPKITYDAAKVYEQAADRSADEIISKWRPEDIASFIISLSTQGLNISKGAISWSLRILGYRKMHDIFLAIDDPCIVLKEHASTQEQTIIAKKVAAFCNSRNEQPDAEDWEDLYQSTLSDINEYIALVGISDSQSLEFALAGLTLVLNYWAPTEVGYQNYFSLLNTYFNHDDTIFEKLSYKLLRDLNLLEHHHYRRTDIHHAMECPCHLRENNDVPQQCLQLLSQGDMLHI